MDPFALRTSFLPSFLFLVYHTAIYPISYHIFCRLSHWEIWEYLYSDGDGDPITVSWPSFYGRMPFMVQHAALVDGTLNKASSITKVADMIMTYKGHSEWIILTVTWLGKQDTILGMTWLKKHNPEIDFTTGTVQLSHCSPCCCTGCWAKIHEEHCIKKEEAWVVNACQTGPLLAFMEDAEDKEDVASDEPTEDPLEEGDWI